MKALGAFFVVGFVLPMVTLFVIFGAMLLGYLGGGDNRISCEAARQEAAQRLGSGKLTDGAVDRLANCKP